MGAAAADAGTDLLATSDMPEAEEYRSFFSSILELSNDALTAERDSVQSKIRDLELNEPLERHAEAEERLLVVRRSMAAHTGDPPAEAQQRFVQNRSKRLGISSDSRSANDADADVDAETAARVASASALDLVVETDAVGPYFDPRDLVVLTYEEKTRLSKEIMNCRAHYARMSSQLEFARDRLAAINRQIVSTVFDASSVKATHDDVQQLEQEVEALGRELDDYKMMQAKLVCYLTICKKLGEARIGVKQAIPTKAWQEVVTEMESMSAKLNAISPCDTEPPLVPEVKLPLKATRGVLEESMKVLKSREGNDKKRAAAIRAVRQVEILQVHLEDYSGRRLTEEVQPTVERLLRLRREKVSELEHLRDELVEDMVEISRQSTPADLASAFERDDVSSLLRMHSLPLPAMSLSCRLRRVSLNGKSFLNGGMLLSEESQLNSARSNPLQLPSGLFLISGGSISGEKNKHLKDQGS